MTAHQPILGTDAATWTAALDAINPPGMPSNLKAVGVALAVVRGVNAMVVEKPPVRFQAHMMDGVVARFSSKDYDVRVTVTRKKSSG